MSGLLTLPSAIAVNAQSLQTHSHVSAVTVDFAVVEAVQASPSPPVELGVEYDQGGASFRFTEQIDQEWTRAHDKRLSELAVKKVLGKATPKEVAELKEMQTLRRRSKCSPTLDEVLFQYHRRQRETKLLRDLSEYVQFLEAAGSAKT